MGVKRLLRADRGSRGEAAMLLRRAEAVAVDTAVLADVRQLADQITAVDRVLARVDTGKLAQRVERLRQEARNSTGARHDATQQAVRAAEERLRIYEQLPELRRTQLAWLGAAVSALEAGDAEELDRLRAGLAESAELSRRLLAAATPEDRT